MKIKTFPRTLIYCSFFLFITSCIKDNTPVPDDYILKEQLFPCNDYEHFEPNIDNDAIQHIHEHNGKFFIGTFERQFFVQDFEIGATFLEESIDAKEMVTHESTVYVCGADGIFSIDESMSFKQETDWWCTAITVSNEGDILFSTNESIDFNIDQIHKLDTDQDTIVPVTERFDSSYPGNGFDKLIPAPNNDIWAVSSSSEIVRFHEGAVAEVFNFKNSPLEEGQMEQGIYILPYNNDIIVVSKNHTSIYMILKYTTGEWIVLKDFINEEERTQKDLFMIGPTITDALIIDHTLYVSTTFAGCRGVQKFDIRKNEKLEDENYFMVHDPSLPAQCVDQILIGENGAIYIVTGQKYITRIGC